MIKFQSVRPLRFYPRDAMLARYQLWPCGRPSATSVTNRCSNETAGRIESVFGTEAFFDLSYTVHVIRKFERITPNTTVLPSGIFVPKCGLRKLRQGTSAVTSVVNLVRHR